MGRLAIRRVIYNGEKYSFESPYLNDGLIIMEGINGHGKSTFMNLIYYALRIKSFHKQFRNQSDDNNIVFSDWILEKLKVEVFDLVQGTKSFKLNFTDLMRLIYHDQSTEVSRVYKEADNSNFLSDSLEIRKAIFEVLLGKTYNDYYYILGQYKLQLKEFEKAQAIMDSYDDFLGEILDYDLANVIHIKSMIEENQEMIERVQIEREIAIDQKSNVDEVWKIINQQKSILIERQNSEEEWIQSKQLTLQSIDKIVYLIDEAEKELEEIEKIRLVNKKLKLFTPNTCPYCLRKVEREKGKCICGNDIAEEQYEKFFYTDEEYLDILKVKKKAILSLNSLLDRKNERMHVIIAHIEKSRQEIEKIKKYIGELTRDIASNYNSAYIRQLDERERELNGKIVELQQAEELAIKREKLVSEVTQLRNKVEGLKIKVESYLNAAKEDMLNKKEDFDKIYLDLMKRADEHCFSAYLGEDYMPHINSGSYRERSAAVPKRLMYFLTLMIESLKNEVNFPRFLMIDTPNKEGIDRENLIKNIALLKETDIYTKEGSVPYQIILTTGIDTYPEEFKNFVFYTLDGDKYLLQENG